MRYISLILFLLGTVIAAQAQTYSYVYIQGDKQTPFYVKLEGDMLPRYGKNYCIIPRLEAGVINIDILFQQNAYPAQHFVIKVPENGSRGFYLTLKNNEFSLYDLQQQFYLHAGNTAEDDHAPDNNTAGVSPATTPVAVPVQSPVRTENKPAEQPVTTPVDTPKAIPQPAKSEPAVPGQPKFIEDIQLDNDHTVKPVARPDNTAKAPDTTIVPVKTEPETIVSDTTKAVPNSDCPQPVADEQFELIYKKALQENEEESRLSYLNGQLDNCYSTAQAGILAKSMDTDAARYTFLKKVYPRVTDQSKFVTLQELMATDVWRRQFMEIVNH